jgi:hypothetical protein
MVIPVTVSLLCNRRRLLPTPVPTQPPGKTVCSTLSTMDFSSCGKITVSIVSAVTPGTVSISYMYRTVTSVSRVPETTPKVPSVEIQGSRRAALGDKVTGDGAIVGDDVDGSIVATGVGREVAISSIDVGGSEEVVTSVGKRVAISSVGA